MKEPLPEFDNTSADRTRWTFEKLIEHTAANLAQALVFGGSRELQTQLHMYSVDLILWYRNRLERLKRLDADTKPPIKRRKRRKRRTAKPVSGTSLWSSTEKPAKVKLKK